MSTKASGRRVNTSKAAGNRARKAANEAVTNAVTARQGKVNTSKAAQTRARAAQAQAQARAGKMSPANERRKERYS